MFQNNIFLIKVQLKYKGANSHLRLSINYFNGLLCQSRTLDYLVILLAHTDEILRLLCLIIFYKYNGVVFLRKG